MTFDSFTYLVFFSFAVVGFFLLPNAARTYFLLALSYLFYMSAKLEYGVLLLFSTALSFFCAKKIASSHSKKVRKSLLTLSIVGNLSVLFFFKYANFFGENINMLIHSFGFDVTGIPYIDVILPVGISFYTFQTISYVVDVYGKKIPSEKKFFTFALFVSFFPQLVAGPIERAKHLLPQLQKYHKFSWKNFETGLLDISVGLIKKIVIADNIAPFVEQVYSNPENYSAAACVIATYLFAVQIYCDFSGYSNIAIGSARILGIRLTKNFEKPYLATSITDFWHRWHISLSNWIRDYIYIPMGGNRGGKGFTIRNLIVVMALAGLWHGASWTFVVWGLFHGFFLGLERMMKRGAHDGDSLVPKKIFFAKYFQILFTFHIVCASWIFFRAESIESALFIAEKSFFAFSSSAALLLFFIANVILFFHFIGQKQFLMKSVKHGTLLYKTSIFTILLLILIFFGAESSTPFIYFQF